MITNIEIPTALVGSFKRVARRIPVDLKKDEQLIHTMVAYLRLGGERLARQVVETAKKTLDLEIAQKRKKAREEALLRAAEARQAAAENMTAEDEDGEDDREDDREDDGIKEY